ncbi:MAG: hypothetical protein ACOC5U_04270 [Candidatus Aminicenantaceae bacterium]
MKYQQRKNVMFELFIKMMNTAVNERLTKTSPFLYEWVRLRAVFEGTPRSRAASMFDPRMGGVAQRPKTQGEEWH